MLVAGFPTGTFQANCYVLAPGRGAGCVIVDPGGGAAEPLDRALGEHALTPTAILATHGHPDHVHAAAGLARVHGVPVWIRPEDRPLLTDPRAGVDTEQLPGAESALLAGTWTEPDRVEELGVDPVETAGLRIDVLHTPGHTPGSVVFHLTTGEGGRIALTGDTLLPGTAGRTDLPGGDGQALRRSLDLLADTLAGDTVLLPGHGPSTTMERERASNPFLGNTNREKEPR